MKGNRRRVRRSRTSRAPSRSCTSAGWTTTFFLARIKALRVERGAPVLAALALWLSDDRGRRARLAPLPLACRDIERVIEALQRAIPVLQHEVAMRRALGRQVLRQRLPLATGRKHVEDGVQNLADIASSPMLAIKEPRRPQPSPRQVAESWRSSNATSRIASSFCPSAGLSSAPSHGSATTVALRATSSATRDPPPPSFASPSLAQRTLLPNPVQAMALACLSSTAQFGFLTDDQSAPRSGRPGLRKARVALTFAKREFRIQN
jgi:hypothetical protein